MLYTRPNADDPDLIHDYITKNYEGFEYNPQQTKVVNGTGDNKKQINPDGSTIVNIYYDRIEMDITFYYRSSDLSGASYETSGDDIYVKTDSNGRKPQYGKEGGSFVQLTSRENADATYVFPYKYTASSGKEATMFGVDSNNSYVRLERRDIYAWSKSGTKYTLTEVTTSNSTATSSPTRTQYVLYNGKSGFTQPIQTATEKLIFPTPQIFRNLLRSTTFKIRSAK